MLNSFLGYESENDANKIIFEFADGFVEGLAMLNILRENEAGFVELDRVDDTYVFPIKSSILGKVGDIKFQLVITKDDGTIIKYDPFTMTVKNAIDTDAEMPEDYPSWSNLANEKILEINNALAKLQADVESGKFKGEKGDKGDAGSIDFIIVTELPTENIDESAIYMKSSTNQEQQNTYEELIYVNGVWESLGTTEVEVDLTDYQKSTDLEEKSLSFTYEDGTVETVKLVVYK